VPVAVERAEPPQAGRSLAPHAAAPSAAVRVREARRPRGDVNVSRATRAQAEVAIAVDRSRPAVLVAGSAIPASATPSDQFLPASAVDATTGRLWACWYDTRRDPTRQRARYTCSSSGDGGTQWTLPRRAAHAFSDATARAASPFQYGDYAGVAAAAGVARPIWTDSRRVGSLGEEIYANALQLP
jgi:hypothetical protein